LPVVLYVLTWEEECRLRLLQYRVLRRILGFKKEKVSGEWRKLHNEELSDLSSPPNIVWVIKWRSMRWAEHFARMRDRRGVYRGLVGKPEGPLGWEDNIKIDLQEMRCGGVE
jgi:hypothetical protein